MRYAPSLLPVIALCAMLEAAQAAAATIEGSWSGSGIARYQGRVDRLVCRVNFAQVGQKSFRVSAFCSTGDRRYEQSGSVSSTGRDRYRGWVYNAQFNERGQCCAFPERLSLVGRPRRAVCMGSASRGAPLQNGRIPRRVTHALPTPCAVYCSVSSTFTARNAIRTQSVNLTIFVTVESSLCVHVACQTSRRSCGLAFRQKSAPGHRRPTHQVLMPAPCGSMFAYRLRSRRQTARSRFGLSVLSGP